MERGLIHINKWLTPLSWLYGIGVNIRNELFETGVLKSRAYDIPVISVGNITVGGTGKTPHTEYLIRLLKDKYKVAMLSRGYKRKSKGFILASNDTPMTILGDEPYQMKQKFPDVLVAVDKDRRHGIEKLCDGSNGKAPEVILLDDAFQHRYVKPGLSILLVDYNRLICYDKLLPAGRLREPQSEKIRAGIVIVTKCPPKLNPIDFRVLKKDLALYPFQKLYFSTFKYGHLIPMSGKGEKPVESIKGQNVMLLTGIATPKQMRMDLERFGAHVKLLSFGDHHYFSAGDIIFINRVYAKMPSPKIVVTTEKDAARLKGASRLSDELKKSIHILPIEVEIMRNQQESFNENIMAYVRKNSRNSKMAGK